MRHKKCLLVLLMVFILSAIIPMAVMAGAEDSLTVTVDPTFADYNGAAQNPTVTVKDGENTLSVGTDYTYEWKNSAGNSVTELKNAGRYTAVVTGTGSYEGKSGQTQFVIAALSISEYRVIIEPQTFTGFPIIPNQIVFENKYYEEVEGVDYTVSTISNNTDVGTASINLYGTGNFIGSANGNFLINPASFSNVQITVDKTLLIIEDGQFVPEITSIKLGEYALAANDYVVSYEDAEGTELSAAPTAAGSYKLVVAPGTSGSFNGDAQKIAFEIKAAVAKIGDEFYASFEDAIAAANEMTGKVTIDLLDDVTWTTGAAHGSTPFLTADSTVTSLTINGNAHKLTAVGQGIGSIRAANNGVLNFNNMTIKDESESYAESSWEHGYLEFGGKLNFADVDFVNAIMITRDNGQQENCESTFTNCKFNSNAANEYDIWVSQGAATFNNCEFTGFRGAKTHEAYDSEVGTLTFNQCSFKNLSVKPGLAVGTVNTNTTVIFDTCTFVNVQAGDQGLYILESDTKITDYNLIFRGTQLVDGTDAIVAKIGDRGFITIDSAFAAVKAGDTLEILKAGDYTLPSSLPNITLQGNVAGVKFAHTSGGNISAISNGITFKNLTFNFGNVDYHGFQHAGTINMVGCTLNGKFFSYSDMNFTDCTFNAPGVEASGVSSEDYSMWAYAGNLTYTNCSFNGAGKFINVYNESGATRYTITATDCTFNSTKSGKAAFNVKETCGSKVLQYTVNLSNNTTTGAFPAVAGVDQDVELKVFSNLVQVDDRVIGGTLNGGEIVVNVDDEQVYITPKMTRVAKIGEVEYVSLDDAFAAAQSGDTVEIIVSEVELPATAVIPAGVTLKGNGPDQTTVKITTSNGDGVKITKTNVVIKDVKIDGSAITSGGYKSLINVEADGCVIDNVVFSGGGMSTWNSSILVESIPATGTFTVKNSTITGSFRGVLRESCNANIVIENCDIDAIYPINIDGGSDGTVTVTGSKLHGWTSYSGVKKVTFTNCEFSKGNSGYDCVAAYVDTEFNNCTFDSSFDIYAQTSPFTFTLNDCSKNGEAVLRDSFVEQFPNDDDVWQKCDTYVNGKLVGAVAEVISGTETKEYKSLQKALDAAHELTGETTVKLIKDITEVAVIHQKAGLNLVVDGNGNTITGQLHIDGNGRANGTETLAISDLKFAYDATTYEGGFINLPNTKTGDKVYTTGGWNYAHNITVSDCEFSGEYGTTVAFNFGSIGGGIKNITLKNLTADSMHSLTQMTGVENVAIEGCKLTNSKNGISLTSVTGEVSVKNSEIYVNETADGYTFRIKGGSSASAILSGNTFRGHEGIVNDSTEGGKVTIIDGKYAGALPTDPAKFLVKDGVFSVAPAVAVCNDGLYPIANTDESTKDDYPYTVGAAVAAVDGLGYMTFEKAAEVANNGEKVITLLADITDEYTLDVNETLKVAHNGKELTVKAPEGDYVLKAEIADDVTTYTVATAVAKIGDVLYASLDEAIAAVPTDGTETTITVIADHVVDVSGYALTVPATKSIVLDLNGKTVTGACSDASTSALICNLGTLTINDSSNPSTGKLIGGADQTWTWDGSDDYSGSYASNLIRNEGTLVVNGGYLYNASSGSAAYAIDNYSAGKVTINGGTVDAKKSSAIRMFYNNGGVVTVTGGTIGHYNSDSDCTYMGIQAQNGTNAVINVSGGTIAGYFALYSSASESSAVNITKGSFDGYVGFGTGLKNISIAGGKFNEWVGVYGDQTEFITGGVFADNPGFAYCGKDAEGNRLYPMYNTDDETNDDYPYTVGSPVAVVNNFGYESVAEAKTARSSNDDVITLVKNAEYAFVAGDVLKVYKVNDQIAFTYTVEEGRALVISEPDEDGVVTYTVADAVAAINETLYATLQAALDAAHGMSGDVTVTLLKDITEVAVIHQKAGLNLTVDGDGKTITGQLYVDGDGRYNDTDTLTIQNIKFAYDSATYDDAFIDVPSTKTAGKPYTTDKYNYAHNITVKNCEFAGEGTTTVAFRVASNAGANKVTLNGNTVTSGHSFAQLVGVKDLTITDNTVTGTKNGINISGGDGTGMISGNTLTAQGYTVRVKDNSGMNVTLSENTFSGEEGIVNESKNSVTTVTTFIVSGFYDGHFTTGNAGKIEITGGYFVEVPAFEYCGKDTNGNQLYPILNEDEATKEAYPYTVGTAVAAVENLAYGIFTDAVAAANNGEKVITLLADIAEPYTLSAEETLKVALEGKELTVNAPEGYVLKATETDGVTTYTVATAVAKIGNALYATLQEALDAAHEMTGDVTVTLIANIEGYSIVHQKAGLNLTIDGGNNKIDGQIIIDGDGRANGTETLTIKNVKFEGDTSNFVAGTDAFILVPSTKDANKPYTTGKYNYAHNITITDCTMTSTSSSLNVVGYKATSGAGDYNITLNNITGTNLHSLAQLTGTTGGTFTNCNITASDSFVNISGGTGDFIFNGNTFESAVTDGYGVRLKDNTGAVAYMGEGNSITASKPLVLGKNAEPGNGGTFIVTAGYYAGDIAKITTSENASFQISGGYFDREPDYRFIVEGKAAVQIEENLWTIGEAVAKITRNGETTYYGTLQNAINAAQAGDKVELLKDVTENIEVATGKDVKLDLCGHSVTNATGYNTVRIEGKLTVETSVEGGKIVSTNNCGICVAGGELVFNSGAVEAQEMAVLFVQAGKGIINNGTFTAKDNAVLGSNGTAGIGGNVVTVNGGQFNGTIQSAGYVACGIYAANNDTWTINGGKFDITGGAGIVARAGNVVIPEGSTVEINTTGNATGMVGDSRIVIPCAALVFDSEAAYPGMDANSAITVADGKFTSESNSVAYVGDSERIVINGGAYSDDSGNNVKVKERKKLFKDNDNYYRLDDFVIVTFDADNADDDTDVTKVEIQKGTAVAKPDDPTNGEFVFNGWFEADATAAFDFTTEITEDITLTAQWKTTVIYDVDGVKTELDAILHQATPTIADPTKDNYTFAGWLKTDATATGVDATVEEANVTYTAQWKGIPKTVIYTDGLGNVLQSSQVPYGDPIPEYTGTALTGITREGYAFDPANPWIPDPTGTVEGDIVFVINWTEAVASITKNNVTTYYASLRLAVAAAEAGDTIDLLRDDVVSFAAGGIVIDKNLTIDGHGYTVKGLAEYGVANVGSMGDVNDNNIHGFYIKGGNVTIKDLEMTQFGDSDYVNKFGMVPVLTSTDYTGTLTLENVDINKFNRQAICINGGTFSITGGTINGNAANKGDGFDHFQQGIEIRGGSGTIEGVTVKGLGSNVGSPGIGIVSWSSGNVTIKNVDIDVNGIGIEADYNTVTVTGDDTVVKATDKALFVEDGGKLIVNAGTYTGSVAVDNVEGSAIEISDGRYSEYVDSKYVVEGKLCTTVKQDDDYYHIVNAVKVTFVTEDGITAPEAQTIPAGEKAVKPADPQKNNYNFLGWFADGATEAFDFDTAITADTTLTAKWEIVTYTVTFDSNGGSDVEAQTVDHGGKAEKPADPTKDGYIFAGWTLDDEAYDFSAPVTGDITLVATWTEAVAKIGDTLYATLKDAVNAAEAGDTIELLKDVNENLVISGGKDFTLDLGGHTMTGYLDQYDANVTIKNGKVAGTIYANGLASGKSGKLTIAADATVEADFAIILWQADDNTGNGQTIDINGTVNGIVWVMGNITEGNSVINVNDGAKITGDDVGIALNGVATVNVKEGATVTGTATGIEVRAGELNVTGGTITGGNGATETNPNGSGTTTSGAGIAVAQHTTKLDIKVTVSGGTITGATALNIANPEGNSEGTITLAVTGGIFNGPVTVADNETRVAKFVSGGDFSKTVKPEYVVDGKLCTTTLTETINGKNYYYIVDAVKVTFDADNGTEAVIVEVPKGETVARPENDPTKEGFVFLGWFDINNEYNFTKHVYEDLTLKAHWEENKFEITYEWSADNKTVTAKAVCTNNPAVETIIETVNTTSAVKTPATCETVGTTTYTAEFENDLFETQTKNVDDIDALDHDWDEPTYEWAADYSSVTATRTCKRDATHVETETVNTTSAVKTAATCETAGTTTYTATFTNTAFAAQTKDVENIDAIGHDWNAPTYEWAADNSTVTATRTCKHNEAHVETETVNTTSAIKTAATCEGKGTTTYTATFTNPAFAAQTKDVEDINAIGHDWNAPTYEWAADNSTVTATRTCKNDPTHVETETVNTTSAVKTAATCETAGTTTYTATFTNTAFATQTKDVEVPALGHDYGTPTYTWSDDNKTVTATLVCQNDSTHTITETVNATFATVTAATCTDAGEGIWVAKFTNTVFTTQVKTVAIEATGHDWNEPTYVWADDNSTVTATRTCKHDASHVETETVNTTSAVKTAATCEAKGITTYTATFTNTAFAAQTKDVEDIDALGHDWNAPTYEWAADNSTVTATRTCKHNEAHVETETVTTTSEITTAATCEGKGTTTYTATFTNAAFAAQTKDVENINALGHDWNAPTYEWAADNSTVTATRTCKHDSTHVETVTVNTTYAVITAATADADGLGRYTATFEAPYATQTKDVVIPKLAQYVVTVTSSGDGTAVPGGITVAHVTGGGRYALGEKVTISAPAVTGYTFLGWYEVNGETPLSTDLTFEYTVREEGNDLIAVYEPAQGSMFRLTVTGSRFTIDNGTTQRSRFDDYYTPGSVVTLKYTGTDKFLYWINDAKKIVSTDPEYTFTMVADTILDAVYSEVETGETKEALVLFVSAKNYGQVISQRYYTIDEAIVFPTAPVAMGKTFIKWDKTQEDIRALMATETRIVVYPIYESNGGDYIVTVEYWVNNAKIATEQKDPLQVNTQIKLSADATYEGEAFSYWTDEEGNILGYKADCLAMYPTRNIVIRAVYGEESDPKPVVRMTDAFASKNGDKNVVNFVATRSIPEGYTIERAGILYARLERVSVENAKDMLTLAYYQSNENGSVLNAPFVGTDLDDAAMLYFTTSNVERQFIARAYIVVKDSQGEIYYIYSDNVIYASYSELNNGEFHSVNIVE